MMKQYDDIIIGFGKGGKTLAAELARQGHKVAMIERSDKNVRRHLYQHRMYPYKNLGSCSQTGSAWRFVDGPKELLCPSHQAKGGRCLPITPKELR